MTAKRNSFQMLVNCQITVTIRMGGDSGSTILRKNPPETSTVDPRRLDQIVGNIDVIVAEEQRGEAQPLDEENFRAGKAPL